MSYPTVTSVQFDYVSLSILPAYSSVTNPTILFNDGTSGIYNNAANSIIFYTRSTTALTVVLVSVYRVMELDLQI
jgi:hypothetical protein